MSRRRRPRWWRRLGWAFDAPRCWCGWYLPGAAGKADPAYTGHALTCPTRFAWITDETQLTDMRAVLLAWAAEQERISADPEWLLEPSSGNWRLTVEVWQAGLTNVAIQRGWERC